MGVSPALASASLMAGVIAATVAGRAEASHRFTLHAENSSYPEAAISLLLPWKLAAGTWLISSDVGQGYCQVVPEGDETGVMLVMSPLMKGERRSYTLVRHVNNAPVVCSAATEGGDVFVRIENALFTRYQTHGGPNKPFFYPILDSDGHALTRHYPMQNVPGESHDHPHHRGLWFTHGEINGIDYWSEGRNTGKTVNTGFSHLFSGPVCAGFTAHTQWIQPDGKQAAEDVRHVWVYLLSDGTRVMDFDVSMRPAAGALVFGDTKEGSFGMRVPDTLCPSRDPAARMMASDGKINGEIWGTRQDWVDYTGPVHGELWGITMMDGPDNLRHPETWHARDYGLFAANPFGLHEFLHEAKGAGDFTLAPGQTLHLRYRLLFHPGERSLTDLNAQYAAYAAPPKVEVAP